MKLHYVRTYEAGMLQWWGRERASFKSALLGDGYDHNLTGIATVVISAVESRRVVVVDWTPVSYADVTAARSRR